MFQNEQWRVIKELPHYLVSNYGRVKRDGKDSVLKPQISDRGHPIVTLYGADSRSRYLRQINVLVAREFLPDPYDSSYNTVWHIDGDLLNVNANNLKWEMRNRVLEWNEMHRSGRPDLITPRVRNNRTGVAYANAYECAMAEGVLESEIVWKIEKQARSTEDDRARYRYIGDNDL